jgi:hypothetical protein
MVPKCQDDPAMFVSELLSSQIDINFHMSSILAWSPSHIWESLSEFDMVVIRCECSRL